MKKGFTLIELLAVIVILAIIALISTPIILNVIDEATKGSFKAAAYGIVKAGELEYTQDVLDGTFEEVTYTYTNGVESSSVEGKTLEYRGTKPQNGQVKVNDEGEVAIAIHNGSVCAEKGYEENEVTLSEKTVSECNIIEPPTIICQAVTTATTGNVPTGTFAYGDEYNCDVNGDDVYDKTFFVISNDTSNNTVSLLMNQNIEVPSDSDNLVAWYIDSLTNTNGPLTALTALESATASWSNVTFNYTLHDDNDGTPIYSDIQKNNVHARLMTLAEMKMIKPYPYTEMPIWMYDYLDGATHTVTGISGYWTSSSAAGTPNVAISINVAGNYYMEPVTSELKYGVRPVITIPTSAIE